MALGMFMFVKVMSSLNSVMSLSLFVFSVCASGRVVGYFWCSSFLCEFCFLYCDDVLLVFSPRFCSLCRLPYVDLKYDDVFVLYLIVVCEWVGGRLFVMGCCVVCVWCCCYVLCGCVNGASKRSGLYCRCFICVHFRLTQCVWLQLIGVFYSIQPEVTHI